MAINLYSKASVDSLLSAKLSISSLTNAAATTLNATAPTTGQVLSFDGTELKWATPAGGATWGSITGTLSSQSDLNTALNARVSTAGDTMDNNALLEFNDTTTNSHLGITGNAVTIENAGLGLSSTLDKDKLSITDGTDTAEFTLGGINFADGTVQTTAYTGGATPGGVTYSSPYLFDTVGSSNITAIDLGSGYLICNDVTGGNAKLDGFGLTLAAASGANIMFADGTTQSTAPHDLPIGGTTGQVLTKNSATNYDASWATVGGGGGGGVNIQTFGSPTTSGTFTWTKPANAKWVEIWLFGAGGGGGSGIQATTATVRTGGGGGSGGSCCHGIVPADQLGSTQSVVIAAGGAGGAARALGLTGLAGGSPTNTIFGIFRAYSGGGGAGGNNSAAAGGTGRVPFFSAILPGALGAGGAGNSYAGTAGSNSDGNLSIPTGGGGGGGAAAASTTNRTGGHGGGRDEMGFASGVNGFTLAGGARGTVDGVQATSGTSSTNQYTQAGTGGGGGFYITGAAGGTGGNGGWPGGGGGGGGASDAGFSAGAGGSGANGFAVIVTYCG